MPAYKSDNNLIKNSSVLITGGSGLIGRHLTSLLLSEGFKVSHLSRNTNQFGKVRVFRWDPDKKIIDPFVFEGVDYIIHLAGVNIGEKRWSRKRKEVIVNSRVESAQLLFRIIKENGINLKAFISSSAVGYYGSVTSDRIFKEEDPPATDFLGSACRQWEEAADLFDNLGIRTIKVRTAVVLDKEKSALSKLMYPSKFGLLFQTGNGKQYMPWIHISDLCNIFLKAIKDTKMNGTFNAVSPQHMTHKDFMITLARVIKKPVFPLPVPALSLRLVLGEMSDIILKGSRISSEKILNNGYIFQYPNLNDALQNLIWDK